MLRGVVHKSIGGNRPALTQLFELSSSAVEGGSVIVIDMGRLTVNTDLQSDVPEESTKMEAEERLYDRFNVALSDIQVLFSDSGEEWRVAKQASESEMHLVPKAKIMVVFSNSVRPDCKNLPSYYIASFSSLKEFSLNSLTLFLSLLLFFGEVFHHLPPVNPLCPGLTIGCHKKRIVAWQKLNISVPSLKLNLSDRRISMIADFLQNIPLPKTKSEPQGISSSPSDYHLCGHALREPSGADLKEVWKCLHRKQKLKTIVSDPEKPNQFLSPMQRSFSASDHSDEEEPGGAAERWARIIDLPGFEDNVSASNYIRILFRLVAGEVSIQLARSSDHSDKPYLMLRAEKLCVDAAHMVYGPALQASLHRIQLVDKLHKGSSGEYLELISSDNGADMVTVLYRKVQANCPEFKSHFHQVEHSLVLDVSTLSMAFHREAFITLARFLQYVTAKLKPKSSSIKFNSMLKPTDLVLADSSDPPVPPGATKFSISARMNALRVRLCDTELDLADLKVVGLETDYVLKANEKSVLRVNLSELSMEDLVEDTLYKKILSTEGDKVFDIKWVRRSPQQKEVIEGRNKDALPVRVDGSLTVRFGRTVVVLLHTFANELHVSEFQQSGLRYQVSVEIQAPTILLPQKSTSPNALILQLGELSVENFFQEEQDHCIDNLLIRLHALQLARAVILLDSRMEILEPILEPLKLRLDIKRTLKPKNNEGLKYQVNGSMDLIKINVGQRDLSTMITIYQDNYARLQFMEGNKTSDISPDAESGPEESVRKLEVFLYTSTDVRKESSFTFIMEGLVLTLYTDAEDMWLVTLTGVPYGLGSNPGEGMDVCKCIMPSRHGSILNSRGAASLFVWLVEGVEMWETLDPSQDILPTKLGVKPSKIVQLCAWCSKPRLRIGRSSNVRDPDQALTSFSLDEASLSLETTNDKSIEMKLSCQAATLVDLRAPKHSSLRKIFQSYSGDAGGCTGVAGISLSMPPMVDLTYRRAGSGDAAGFQQCDDEEDVEAWMACDPEDCGFQMLNDDEIVTYVQEKSDPVDDETDEDEDNNNNESSRGPSNADALSALETVDAVVEKIRLNVSVSYLLGVMKYVSDALPGSRLPSSSAFLEDDEGRERLPSDCTSGYLSTISSEDPRALSLSVIFRKPEIVLFAQPDASDTGVLVLKMDVTLDYSFNLGQGNFVLFFAGLHMLSCIYGRRKHTMCTVLYPCEVELNRSLRLVEEEVQMSASVSSVQLCLSAAVVQTILQVSKQLLNNMQLGKTPKESYARMVHVYEYQALSMKCVYEWFACFREGRESVPDKARTGSPVTSISDENIEKGRELITKDRRLSVRMTAELKINC
ncbi:vacuolar protein sorting-associated protein 13C [Trichonephila clavipes]|nr:vacuolar protein sorting-associated protein 13C [Trichonephila clavipes]